MAAIGWERRSPLDVKLSAIPPLNADNKDLMSYVRQMSNDSTLATSIVQILIKEQWEAHRMR